jgi:hypothetical protein
MGGLDGFGGRLDELPLGIGRDRLITMLVSWRR